MSHIPLTSNSVTIDTDTIILDYGEVVASTLRVMPWVILRYVFLGKDDGEYTREFILEWGARFQGGGVLFAKKIRYQASVNIIWDRVSADLKLLGLATDESRIDIRGSARVDKPYRDIHARVDQTNILMGRGANIRGMPILEVATDDIDWGHSCRVHRIAWEALFYLQSRGLDTTTAEWLLIDGELRKHTSIVGDCEECDMLVDEIRNTVFPQK